MVNIQKHKVRTLLDSGSQCCLMSAGFYKSLKERPTLKKCNANLQSVNSGQLTTLGKVHLNFDIKGVKLSYDFFVVEGINRCLIFGDDWMTDNGVRIYFDLGLIRIKGVYAPLLTDKHVSSVVRLVRGITLRPNTTYAINARVKRSSDYNKDSECMVSSLENGIILNEPGVEIKDSVIKLSSSNKFIVEISNHNNRCIRLKKGRILGQLEVIDNINVSAVNNNTQNKSGHSQVRQNVNKQEILSQIHTDSQYRSTVENLVQNNLDCFAFSESDIVPSDLVTMKIELTDETPFKIRPYRAAVDDQKAIDKTVSEWLSAGIVSRSRSPFSSSVVVVNKKDGEKRVCVDFRKLNAVTKAYVVRLPTIDEILSKLGGAKYISTFDLKSGFFNVPLDKKSKEYTSFTTLKGQFAFNRAPFGLRNSPSYFVELMQLALDGLDEFCTFYVDDIIVWSNSLEEHLKHINMLFERLRKHKLKLKLKKCQFMKAESNHLGFIVTSSGVKPDPEKVRAIRTLGPPTNVKECRSFVALCSYYRRFVPNFAKISEPIVALTKKYARFKWTEEAQKAFEYMKESLTVIPQLAYPDPSRRFILYTDASDTAIGSCLVQEHEEDGEVYEKPLYFLSHKLSPTQCRWSTVEKEAWAIHHSLEKLNSWISCSQILVRTDHQPLKYLLNSETGSFNRKINSWALTMASYNIDVEYLPGKQNLIADLLSRRPKSSTETAEEEKREPEPEPEKEEEPLQVNHIDSSKFDPSQYLNLKPPLLDVEEKPTLTELDTKEEQKLDENITSLKKNLEAGKLNKTQDKSLIVIEDILYFISDVDGSPKLRLYLPEHLVDVMIRGYHDNSHLGIDKVYDSMKRKYYCPNMYKRISEYTSKCVTCQERNRKFIKPPMGEMDIPLFPFSKVACDFVGPLPRTLSNNAYILHFHDLYSGWMMCFATPDKSSDTVCSILVNEVLTQHSHILCLLTDNGKEFTSGKMKETLAALNIKHITTSFYSPQANGAAEKAHLTLMNVLSKKIQGNPEIWDLYLGQACAAINFSVHESSKFSPFFLLYNRDPILPVDSILSPRQKYNGEDVHRLALEKQHEAFMLVHKHLREAKKKSARRFNEEADNEPFQVGDPVYLKNHTRKSKLDGFAAAFYRIVEQKSPHTFLCRNQLDGTMVESHARHMRHARIDGWKITKQDRNRKLRKARYVVSPPSTDTEPQEKEKPLDRLVKMNKQHRSGSSDEEDIPKLELSKRIMARQRRLKRENADSSSCDSSDNTDGNDSSDKSNDRYSSRIVPGSEHSSMEQSMTMDNHVTDKQNGYSSDTEEYFSTGEFERNQEIIPQGSEQMEVDAVVKHKHTKDKTKRKVKRLLHAMSSLLD